MVEERVSQLNGKEVAPMGERGTGAGVRCRRHLAESEVGVEVPKNIGKGKIIKGWEMIIK